MSAGASGSSRLVVGCCCLTFLSVLLFSVVFVRLELELRTQREKIRALQEQQELNPKKEENKPSLKQGTVLTNFA